MITNKIVVIGSANTDMVVKSPKNHCLVKR